MRHNISILLGEDMKQFATRLAKYIHKYGEGDAQEYCRVQSWMKKSDGMMEIKKAELDCPASSDFVSTLQDMFATRLADDAILDALDYMAELRRHLTKQHQQIVTINNGGDNSSLLLTIYLPLYDIDLCNHVEEIVNAASNIQSRYNILIVGLCHDIRHIIHNDNGDKENAKHYDILDATQKDCIEKLATLCKGSNILDQVVVLQNTNAEGFALSLDKDSIVRIMGELSLLVTEKYDTIFTQAAKFDQDHPLCTLGISVLNLDKYYFEDFLLRQAYLHILDKEDVNAEKVDVNKVAIIADKRLKQHKNLFSDFYRHHIEPLAKQGVPHDNIISQTAPKLQKELESVTSHLTDYINDNNLTLPEKKALLAVILGYDDPLLVGNLFNQEQLTLDNLDEEVANIFISENNKLVSKTTDANGKISIKKGPLTMCCNEDGMVELPIKRLQQLRNEMRESTNYIRQKTEELNAIDQMTHDAEVSEKRFTNAGFVIDGNVYHFDTEHKEIEFEETYEPQLVTKNNIDLREYFTPIKNQGEIGACTVFAVASIFEYILKKNSDENYDLSESFVYYNVRRAKGNEDVDTGSSFQDVIKSMGTEGICTEQLHPYTKNLSAEPSDEAYLDGKSRRIIKALNVAIEENAIKSAIQDGYPVAISLKVYDSFSTTTFSGKGSNVTSSGFVTYPTEAEIDSEEFGYHAMVVVGFIDDTKHFVVRNSWGKEFGDKGYCYIPYSYVCDHELNRFACIVTEVNATSAGETFIVRGRGDIDTIVQFNTSDAYIKTQIIKNLIDAEQRHLKLMQNDDVRLRKNYETLMQELGRQSKRKEIMANRQTLFQKQIDSAKERQREINEEKRHKILRQFDDETFKIRLCLIGWIVIFFIWWIAGWIVCIPNESNSLTSIFQGWRNWISSGLGITISIFLTSGIICAGFYFWWIKSERRKKEMELEEESANVAQEIHKFQSDLDVLQLRFHVAGMVIDGLLSLKTTLDRKYQAMKSYIGNLSLWQKEEQKATDVIETLVKNPFIPLLDNATLDKYFKDNKENITGEMHLYEYFNGFHLDDNAIIAYKYQLKQNILRHITSLLDEFSIYRHIFNTVDYPYIDKQYASASNLLPLLDRKSEPFCQIRSNAMTKPQATFLFVKTDSREKNAWQREYPQYFSTTPISEDISSTYKILALRLQPLSVNELLIV